MTEKETAPDETLTAADVGVIALLQLLTELRTHLGLDPDGSATAARMLGILGTYRQLGCVVSAAGEPWDPACEPAIKVMRRRIKMAAPVIARLARPG